VHPQLPPNPESELELALAPFEPFVAALNTDSCTVFFR
jgi:hypothetical protein